MIYIETEILAKYTDGIMLLYIDLFCGAGGTSTGVEKARLRDRNYKLIGNQTDQKKFIGNAVEVHMAMAMCTAIGEVELEELMIAV